MSPETKTKIKKIYNIFSTVIFAVVFLFFVLVIIFSMVQKNQGKDVKIFGHYMYTILTDSMVPTLNPSDVIWCKAIEEGDIVEGAIITFVVPEGHGGLSGRNDTHRIVEIERDENGNITGIYTQGDNSTVRDNWKLTVDDVKAVMSKKLVVVSALIKFISEYRFLAYMVLIVLPLGSIAVMFGISYVREKVKEKKAETAGGEVALDDLSDEDKKKMLEEFLAQSTAEKSESEENDQFGEGNSLQTTEDAIRMPENDENTPECNENSDD